MTTAAATGSAEVTTPGRRRITPAQLVWGSIILFELAFILFVFIASIPNPNFGLDYRWHMDSARRLLETGTPYYPYQLERHYTMQEGPILYPPIAWALFIPFLYLPAILWWAIPIGILVWCMTRHRPPMWAWAATLACFCFLFSIGVFIFGNPGMWIVAAVAAGTVWSWPFVFVFLKPTFAPIALLGVTHRSWWIALVALGLVSLLFWPVWFDWITIVRNSEITFSYNFPTLPLMIAPLIPWFADKRHPIHGWIARFRARRAAAR
jgi:hypothetical protein